MKALTQEQVDSYRYNGFLFPIPALDTRRELQPAWPALRGWNPISAAPSRKRT